MVSVGLSSGLGMVTLTVEGEGFNPFVVVVFFLRVTAAVGPVEFGLSWIDCSAEALLYQGNPCVEQLEEVDGLLVVDLLL